MTPSVSSKASILLALLLTCLLFSDATAEWLETAKLTDSHGEEDDFFGESAAIDNGIVVVGASSDDIDVATNAGSATIIELSDCGEWVAQQKLTASDGEAGDGFGGSVAISNGVVAVGAEWEDDGGDAAGAVYIFEKTSEGVWTESQKLIHSDAGGGSGFGYSLAMQDSTLVVGAPLGDSWRVGSVFLFIRLDDIWTQVARLTASDRSHDNFGEQVAIDVDTILIGAPRADSGSAYVFQRAEEESSWTQVAKLTPSDGRPSDYFGRAVALEGGTIFVGSYNNADGEYVGAVYQFGEEMATWTQQNKLVARDFERFANFGGGLAVRDGTLVVGAPDRSTRFAIDAGAVYLFENSAEGTWTQRAKLVATDGASYDYFGYVVAVDNGMVIAGAWGDDSRRGSVYAFEWRASETSVRPSAAPEAPTSSTATPTSASFPGSVTEIPTSSTLTPTSASSPNSKSACRSAVVDQVIYIGVSGGGMLLSAVLLCF